MSTPMSAESFRAAYLQFLVKVWSDEEFAASVQSEPADALRSAGIELPADAVVTIVTKDKVGEEIHSDTEAMSAQTNLYIEGHTSGKFTFYVPSAPTVEAEELSEKDLADVAGAGDKCCCCCCC